MSQPACQLQLQCVPSPAGLDRTAFLRLYDGHACELLVFFTRRTLDPEIARDLWAETFAQAFAARARCRAADGTQAASWLYGIAYRQLAMYHRRGRTERRAVERLGLQGPSFTEVDIDRLVRLADVDALRGSVAAALDALAPALRDAVRLRIVEELEYPDVAARLGVSEHAARARVSRGLRSLQQKTSQVPPDLRTLQVNS